MNLANLPLSRKTPLLLALLESRSLEVKISAGQAVALLFELVPQDCEVSTFSTVRPQNL